MFWGNKYKSIATIVFQYFKVHDELKDEPEFKGMNIKQIIVELRKRNNPKLFCYNNMDIVQESLLSKKLEPKDFTNYLVLLEVNDGKKTLTSEESSKKILDVRKAVDEAYKEVFGQNPK